ncbi:Uma2 family endonuclease, partial [Rhizobiaceae sp. 2RAB30]
RYDRFQKLAEYQQHPAVKVVLLVDSEAPQVTIWRRGQSGWAPEEALGLDAVIELPEIGTVLALSELYRDIRFDPPPV